MGCAMLLLLLLAAAGIAVGAALLGTLGVGVALLVAGAILLFVRSRAQQGKRALGILGASCSAVGLVLCLSVGAVVTFTAHHVNRAAAEAAAAP